MTKRKEEMFLQVTFTFFFSTFRSVSDDSEEGLILSICLTIVVFGLLIAHYRKRIFTRRIMDPFLSICNPPQRLLTEVENENDIEAGPLTPGTTTDSIPQGTSPPSQSFFRTMRARLNSLRNHRSPTNSEIRKKRVKYFTPRASTPNRQQSSNRDIVEDSLESGVVTLNPQAQRNESTEESTLDNTIIQADIHRTESSEETNLDNTFIPQGSEISPIRNGTVEWFDANSGESHQAVGEGNGEGNAGESRDGDGEGSGESREGGGAVGGSEDGNSKPDPSSKSVRRQSNRLKEKTTNTK